jgi:hypothetical protein
MTNRSLTDREIALLTKILEQSVRANDYLKQLAQLQVDPVDALGSLRFVAGNNDSGVSRPHRFIDVKGVMLDTDGIPILLCVFEDKDGMLYMLDVQKMGGGRIDLPISIDQMEVEPV